MVLRASCCLRQLSGERRGERQAGRFFANPKVTTAQIISSWSEHTGAAVAGRHVLALQDTTLLSFATGHEAMRAQGAKTRRGLGPLNQGSAYGLLAHVMLAVEADSQACLGLIGGAVWNRDGFVSTPEWSRPLAARESRRWVDTLERADPVLAGAAMVTVVNDCEGEMYPLWARATRRGYHVLSRVGRDRELTDGGRLFAASRAWAVADQRSLELPARAPGQAKRAAQVRLRFGPVEIRRSPNEKDRSLAKALRLTLIDIEEVDPPAAAEALHWRLLTTHTVSTAGQAWQVVGWYQARWGIEQLFRLLKMQGLQLENSQLSTAERLSKLSAAAVKAACMTLQLVQERDGRQGLPAMHVFSQTEIHTLEALTPTLQGAVPRQRNPHPPGSLARAAWVIARLGGWNGYGKPPGPITMHRGLQRFHAIQQGYLLAAETKQDVGIP
jgi:Transposase DDE domain